jgi:biopolymer transport protein ExbB
MSESITHAIVRGTFGLLLLASVLTWALVLVKARQRWVIRRQDGKFLRAAGAPLRLGTLRTLSDHRGPAFRVVQAGLAALADLDGQHGDSARQAIEPALQAQLQRERRASESGLAVLASIGSTAPFVGLFGTVWGIIQALRAIGHSGSASLEVVAGPIGEALVATGLGIAVAVPAVLAYNFFVRRLKVHAADLEQLAGGFLGALARTAHEPALRVERSDRAPLREASV